MPKLIAAKHYPALVDVYVERVVQDPLTGDVTRTWDYENPFTYVCNFMSLKGHAEKFGEKGTYDASDAVKVEVKPEDARFVTVAMRFGNLRKRTDDTQEYYRWVGRRSETEPYYFNIDSMNPQVDTGGRIVCVEIYGQLATLA